MPYNYVDTLFQWKWIFIKSSSKVFFTMNNLCDTVCTRMKEKWTKIDAVVLDGWVEILVFHALKNNPEVTRFKGITTTEYL